MHLGTKRGTCNINPIEEGGDQKKLRDDRKKRPSQWGLEVPCSDLERLDRSSMFPDIHIMYLSRMEQILDNSV
jgi:hypothetical protein